MNRFVLSLILMLFVVVGLIAATDSEDSESTLISQDSTSFDFETNTVEGWEYSSKAEEQGITAVSPTSNIAHQGQYSLALETNLDDSDSDLKQGMAFVMVPGDMAGRTISAQVWCPDGAQGDVSNPNGIQLFVKDQNFRSQFSSWRNIGTSIPVNEWVEIQLTPSETNSPGGYTDSGFDPSEIMIAGIKLGAGTGSQVPFQGSCYLDSVSLSRADLIVPGSDNLFNFDSLTTEQQQNKPFGYGPYFDIDPNWQAEAWNSGDISIQNQMLAISATFTLDTPGISQKGFIGVELLPNIDISNKDNRVIRAEVRFDPYIGPERMLATIFVYDRRDAEPDCTGSDCKWFRSRDIWVGGSEWNEILFDLDDPTHFFTDTAACPNCLLPTDITTDSLQNILKVGIQFYANEAYTGTIYLDNVTIAGNEQSNFANCNLGLVTRAGTSFWLNGQTYRFGGNNSYYLFYKSPYMVNDVMETMQRNNISVLRIWGFGDGKAPFANDGDGLPNGNEGSAFQPEPRLYYEPTFAYFDYILKSAGEHCVRLMIPLINHWSDKDIGTGQNSFGGMSQYLEWCNEAKYEDASDPGRVSNKADFYTSDCAKQLYKDYLNQMLNRVNKLTGVKYKDDPTILAWTLANEPRCQESDDCPSDDAVYDWTAEMSAYIKDTLQAQQLVGLGDEGFICDPANPDIYYNCFFGLDWDRNLTIDTIDFGTVHLYPDHWDKNLIWAENWITDHIDIAQQVGKPVIFEEFGICEDDGSNPFFLGSCDNNFVRDEVYTTWTNLFENGAAGDLVWMIAGQVNGVNEDHEEINGNYYYPDYDGFTFWEPSSTMSIISEHTVRMNECKFCVYLPIIIKK